MSFLNAEWRNLAIANYTVKPSSLKKHIPAQTELDFYNGNCYVSLVGFMFVNTRLLGIPIPFHRNFEEVNLRFYVRHFDNEEWKRGVVFIKEIVPKPAITYVANTIYKEHYQTMKMSHIWDANQNHKTVKYNWSSKLSENSFEIKAKNEAMVIPENSEEEFITEHYWGYTKVNENKTTAYEVKHPRWEAYRVLESNIQVDFATNYGDEFSDLSSQKPTSVMLAEGSEISVENKMKLSS